MRLSLTAPLLTPAAYPDLTITNPKLKTKAWIMQAGQAHVTHCLQSGSRDFYNGRARYKLAELYANGENEVRAVLLDENGRPDPGAVNLRKPLKIMKKVLRAVHGKLKDQDFTATVTAIDATAIDAKERYEAYLRSQMENAEDLKKYGQGPKPGEELPIDEDDLQMRLEHNYRHQDAMLLEMKLALALYQAAWNQQNRLCLVDDTVYGSDAVYMALRGPRRVPVRLYPGDCFILPSSTEDYANLQAGAHIERVSLAQVLKEIDADPDTTLSAAQRDELIALAKSRMPNGGSGYGYAYNSELGDLPELAGQLDVIRFSFKTQDEVVVKELENRSGNKEMLQMKDGYAGPDPSAPLKAKQVKLHRQTVASWYEGSLIDGTEIGYGCRKAYEQLRDEDNPFDCHPLYVVTSPDMLGGFTESMVEQCMTLVDTACDAFARLRHILATMPGSWIEFDIDAIEAGALEKSNGTKMTADETIKHFLRNRYIAARKGNANDADGKAGPIVTGGELPYAKELAEQWNTIRECRAEIEAITGVNGSISAEDPASRQGASVTQMAISGAENTLEYLYFAKQRRFERVVQALAVSIKQSESRAPLTGPVPPGFAGAGRDVVGTSNTLPERVFNTKIERKPTQDQWNRFYEAAKISLSQKEITMADYTFITGIDNLKQATAMLTVRAKRNLKQSSEAVQQQTSMASQQQQESAKVTGEEQRRTNAELHEQQMELQALKNEGAVLTVKAQVEGQAGITEMMNSLQIMKQQMTQTHQTQQAEQAHEVDLTKHSAQLDSNEAQAEADRAHQAKLAAEKPVAAAA